MGTKTVLVLSQREDAHIPPVQEELASMGASVAFCDLADFPERIEMAAQFGSGTPWPGLLIASDRDLRVGVVVIVCSIWRSPRHYHATLCYSCPVRALLE